MNFVLIAVLAVGLIGAALIVAGILLQRRDETAAPSSRDQNVFQTRATVTHATKRGYLEPVTTGRIAASVLWLGILLALADHLLSRNGLTGFIVWAITFGPHEAGHLLCIPFGELFMIAGGSIWQVLLWLLLAVFYWWRKRRLVAMGLVAFAGHSLISLSNYIADAHARKLPLTFGLGSPEQHDWWNLLKRFDLLAYDWLIADVAIVLGALVVFTSAVAAFFILWYRPPPTAQAAQAFQTDFSVNTNP